MLEAFLLDYNKRFACDPQSTHDAHRKLRYSDKLDGGRVKLLSELVACRSLCSSVSQGIPKAHTQQPGTSLP